MFCCGVFVSFRSGVDVQDRMRSVTSTKEGKAQEPDDVAIDAADSEERRDSADRRRRPTPMLSRYVLFGGRRRHVRRDEEREGAFVDLHGPVVLLVVLVIVALNVLDAFFTLLFLSHGGTELNPIVQWVLESPWHPWPFILLKTVGIGLACTFLMMAKYFRPARLGMAFVLLGYGLLLV